MSSNESHVIHHQETESVKLIKNSKSFNYEVKAATIERAFELADQIEAQLKVRGADGATK